MFGSMTCGVAPATRRLPRRAVPAEDDMNRIRALGTLTCVIWVVAGLTGGAYLGPRPSLDELIAEAETIFFGEVVDVRSYWEVHEHGRAIVSRATFRVIHTFKGRPSTHMQL